MFELFTQLLTTVRGMWRFRWYSLVIMWLVCIVGWVVVIKMPDQYKSTARVFVDTQSVLRPLLEGLTVETNVQTKVEMMTRALLSRPNLETVIRETDLDLRATTPQELENLVDELQSKIKIVNTRRQENLYRINYSDINPDMAQLVVQTLLNSLVEQTLGSSREDTVSAQRFLKEQIKDYEQRLTESEQKLAEFKKKNIGLMPKESGGYYSRMQAAMSGLEGVTAKLRVATNRRDALLKQLQGEKNNLGSSDLDARIQEKQRELDNLLLKFTEYHPDVVAVQETIDHLKDQREKNIGKQVSDEELSLNPVYQSIKISLSEVEVEVAALRAEEKGYKKQIDELGSLVDTIPQVEADLARLNRDYSVTKGQYDALVQRLESAKLSEGAEQSSDDVKFRVIDPPVKPLLPSGPKRLLLISMVLFGGLCAGIGLAFILNEVRPVFCTSEDLKRDVGLPVLGVVSMHWSDEEQHNVRKELLYLLTGIGLLLLSYGIVAFLQRASTAV